jgi:hypothetical protein
MSMVTAGIISGGASIISGIFGASAASRRAKAAEADRKDKERKLLSLENSRQEIINPYEGVTDLSSMVQNPYENLGVATQAAEMQAEQADISLANTLDTIRATGASAGGATALAQAALQSKKGVSASIEAQEAQNEKLRAQGEQQQQQMKMAEAQRLQQADVSGKQFEFGVRESREVAKMDRLSAQISGAEARKAQANADRTSAITGAIGGVVSTVGSMYSAGAFKKAPAPTPPPTPTVKSDKRLKKNIEKIGESPSGLNIYSFEYIDNINGEGVYQGVMSDEIPTKAVVVHEDGYDRVDYSKLDVEFKKIKHEL